LTPTKPKCPPIGLEDQRVHELVRIPIFCIGGVNLKTSISTAERDGGRRERHFAGARTKGIVAN
jgi:hypothetical protein